MPLKLAFEKTAMTLAHVNLRSEVHGDEREGAIDLKFHLVAQAGVLDSIDPTWRGFLFTKDKGRPADLVDKTQDAPHARNNVKYPLVCTRGMVGAKVKVRIPGEAEKVSFSRVKVNGIAVIPKDGGIIDIKFRAQVYPTEEQLGKVGLMLQKEVEVTVIAGKEEEHEEPEDKDS